MKMQAGLEASCGIDINDVLRVVVWFLRCFLECCLGTMCELAALYSK